jgi:NAD(P) transhydrogenase subunit alpha
MKAGSVIVDLAAEQQGNCALTETGKVVEKHGVTIMGLLDLPSRLSQHASQMFSRNVEKLLLHVVKEGAWKLDAKDEIVAGCLVTMSGDVVHPKVKERLG